MIQALMVKYIQVGFFFNLVIWLIFTLSSNPGRRDWEFYWADIGPVKQESVSKEL